MSTMRMIPGGKSQPTSEKGPHNVGTLASKPEALTDALEDTERMASILSTLLEERITDTGRILTIRRQDAKDIQFAAAHLVTMLARAGEIWRKLP